MLSNGINNNNGSNNDKGEINMKWFYILIAILFILPSASFSQEHGKAGHEMEKEKLTVKEVHDFHELLHPLVHEAYPAKDFKKIRTAIPDLLTSAKTIRNAELPKGLTGKTKFRQTAEKLYKELSSLNRKKDMMSDDVFGERFMKMHDTFEKIMDML